METIEGAVEKVIFRNPENGYSVVKIEEPSGTITTACGILPDVAPNVDLILGGEWSTHPKYGRQFQIEEREVVVPQTRAGIAAYLSSSVVEGVGPVMARLIVDHFGVDTMNVLDNEPEKLAEVRGVGAKRARAIAKSWKAHRSLGRLMMSLHEYGISTGLSVRIHANFGVDAMAVLRENPYRLTEIRGVGFKRADYVARSMGVKEDALERVQAGLVFVLQEQAKAGHVYVPRSVLEQEAVATLGQAVAAHLDEAIQALAKAYRITVEGDSVYLRFLWDAETDVANRIVLLTSTKSSVGELRNLHEIAHHSKIELSREQRDAVMLALREKVTILTGGPGTGKTVTMKMVVAALEHLKCRYVMCAPTGRAAKRLSETTNRQAYTVHRLLEYKPDVGFFYDSANPLPVQFVIVDEVSMLDTPLTASLLAAIPPDAHVLFVGDVNQLPSVGAGHILGDLIESGQVAVARLTTVFRQAADSGIVVNAHRINEGRFPICNDGFGDFFLFTEKTPEDAARMLVDVVVHRIPEKLGIARDDIQVLAPMYKGECGITNLNALLQEALNPPDISKAERETLQRIFREGDRVMQTQNNYDKGVFNGDVGRLDHIDEKAKRMLVRFDGMRVEYRWSELDELVLAYAISVHKSQGSEYPAVVIPVMTQHFAMLQRNLLYTAVTRAKKLVVLVGTKRAITIAVHNAKVRERNSGLQDRLVLGRLQ